MAPATEAVARAIIAACPAVIAEGRFAALTSTATAAAELAFVVRSDAAAAFGKCC